MRVQTQNSPTYVISLTEAEVLKLQAILENSHVIWLGRGGQKVDLPREQVNSIETFSGDLYADLRGLLEDLPARPTLL